jgi:hypothetical protein
VLVALTAALGKLAPAASVVPLKDNPLEALRRRRAERGTSSPNPLDELVDQYEERKAMTLEDLQRRRAEQRARP